MTFKVGDKVISAAFGEGEIVKECDDSRYTFLCDFGSNKRHFFTRNGEFVSGVKDSYYDIKLLNEYNKDLIKSVL